MGMEEFVEHSFYDDWTKIGPQRFGTDPLGNPLSPYHTWNKTTHPQAGRHQLQGEVHLVHGAPLGPPGHGDRRLRPAVGHRPGRGDTTDNPFFDPTGDGLQMILPRYALPETELFWPLPRTLNALERNRARAYAMAFTAVDRHELPAQGVRVLAPGARPGCTRPFRIPKDERISVGLLGGQPRLPDPPPRHGQGQARQLPDQHPVHAQRLADRPVRRARAPTSRPSSTRRSSSRCPTTRSRASTSCGRSAASTRACRAPPTWTRAGASSPGRSTPAAARSSDRSQRDAGAGALVGGFGRPGHARPRLRPPARRATSSSWSGRTGSWSRTCPMPPRWCCTASRSCGRPRSCSWGQCRGASTRRAPSAATGST